MVSMTQSVKRFLFFAIIIISIVLLPTTTQTAFAKTDENPPVINNITIDKTSVTIGDTITITADITDESEIPFTYAYICFMRPNKSTKNYFFSKQEDGLYKTTITIDDSFINGDYYAWNVSVDDKYGNGTSSFDYKYIKFTVTGAISDENPPVINNITIDKTSVTIGDTITITADITDESEIPFTYAYICFMRPNKSTKNYFFSKQEDGLYKTTITIDDSFINGDYYAWNVSVNDKYGNRTSSFDYKYIKFTIHCQTHTWNTEYTVDKEATCTEAGSESIHCSVCGIKDESTVRSIPAIDHEWNVPTYTWSSDYTSVTAMRTCKHDSSHKETETITSSAEVTKAATYTAKGQTTYTAEFTNPVFTKQTKVVSNIDKLAKKANTLTAKGKTVTVKYTKVKKKAQTITKAKAFTISKAKGTVTFKKTSGNKKITITKDGKITVKKGLKKGTYKLKVKVTAAGTTVYKPLTKQVTLTIKIK